MELLIFVYYYMSKTFIEPVETDDQIFIYWDY